MNRLDKAALTVIIFLAAALLTLAWIGNPTDLQVTVIQESGTGPLGPLTLEFSQPVNAESLTGKVTLNPQGSLTVEPASPVRVNLIPDRVINPKEQVTLRLSPGVYGANGEALKKEQSWVIRIRPAQIVFLGTGTKPSEIFTVALDGSPPVQLTQTNGHVFDFDVSSDGEQIVYTLYNDQGGTDLWRMGRAGDNMQLLLDCGPDRCTTPDFSPDNKRLAYTREAVGISPDSPRGAPRPWVLNLETSENAQVYSDQQTICYGPSWSPDGRRLACWDGVNGGIRVLDLRNGADLLLPTQTGEVGGWSPDGTQMLFTDYKPVGDGYHAFIYRADFNSGEVGEFLGGGESDSAYGTPAWSPDGSQIALSLRLSEDSPARSIWIIREVHPGGPTIGNEPDYLYGFYRWDPWGTALVFQRTHLGDDPNPQIAIYRLDTGEMQVLAEHGGWPQWLP
jgi:WD40 repeat protein